MQTTTTERHLNKNNLLHRGSLQACLFDYAEENSPQQEKQEKEEMIGVYQVAKIFNVYAETVWHWINIKRVLPEPVFKRLFPYFKKSEIEGLAKTAGIIH